MGRLRLKQRRHLQPPPRFDAWDTLIATLVITLTMALYLPFAPHLPGFVGGRFGAYTLLSLGIGAAYHARRKWWPASVVTPPSKGLQLHRLGTRLGIAALVILLLPTIRLPRLLPELQFTLFAGELIVMLALAALAPVVATAAVLVETASRRRGGPTSR